nr:immunoglobulin heavy chain junction region [Mus musculus]
CARGAGLRPRGDYW